MKLHEISGDSAHLHTKQKAQELFKQSKWEDKDILWFINMFLVGGTSGVHVENGVVAFADGVYKTQDISDLFFEIASNMKKLPFRVEDTKYSIHLEPTDDNHLMLGSLEGFPRKVDSFTIGDAPYLFSLKGLPSRLTDLNLTNVPITKYDADGIVEETLIVSGCLKLDTLAGFPNSVTDITISACPGITSLKGLTGQIEYLGLNRLVGLKSLAGCGSYLPPITQIKFERIFLDDSILGLMEVQGLEKILYQNVSSDMKTAFDIINEHLGKDILDCQSALIEAGLERYAEL